MLEHSIQPLAMLTYFFKMHFLSLGMLNSILDKKLNYSILDKVHMTLTLEERLMLEADFTLEEVQSPTKALGTLCD